MTDGIIKGTGNSRFLKTVPNALTLYSDFPAFMEALIAGTFPIDLNGVNPAGWDVQGNKLNKATLLTDALCTALGLPTTATPTQAMEKLRQLVATAQSGVDNGVKLQIVSYKGTGVYGELNPSQITFQFPPKWIYWYAYVNRNNVLYDTQGWYFDGRVNITMDIITTDYLMNNGPAGTEKQYSAAKKSNNGKTLIWYNSKTADAQINSTETTYYVLALG